MKKTLVIWIVSGLCLGASAEMRTWTFKNGQTLEAEFVRTLFDKIRLMNAEGKEITVPMESLDLSENDQEYLELEHPPKLALEIRKNIEKKNFALIRGAEGRPPEWRANFGVKVVQKSSGDYNHDLTVEFFAIGQEIKGNRYILLDHQVSNPFRLSRENKWTFEFHSKRIVRMTDLWDNSRNYSRRGEQYYGFVILVKDKRGEVIAADASSTWLSEPEHQANLQKLKRGNYMDKTCTRTFPSRPKSYIAAQAADRS